MVKKSKQKDLFGLDPKEEEKLLSYESLKEKMYRKAEEKINKRMPTHAQVKVSDSKKLKVVAKEKLETRQGTTY